MLMCMSVWVYIYTYICTHMSAGFHKRMLDPLELELQQLWATYHRCGDYTWVFCISSRHSTAEPSLHPWGGCFVCAFYTRIHNSIPRVGRDRRWRLINSIIISQNQSSLHIYRSKNWPICKAAGIRNCSQCLVFLPGPQQGNFHSFCLVGHVKERSMWLPNAQGFAIHWFVCIGSSWTGCSLSSEPPASDSQLLLKELWGARLSEYSLSQVSIS